MKNQFYTDHDIIMVGVSGPFVDEAGVIAGMSGSPVYIDGKLVGALAYRFGAFPMKPIGGVTPIGHMLAIREVVETEPGPEGTAPGGTSGEREDGEGDLSPSRSQTHCRAHGVFGIPPRHRIPFSITNCAGAASFRWPAAVWPVAAGPVAAGCRAT